MRKVKHASNISKKAPGKITGRAKGFSESHHSRYQHGLTRERNLRSAIAGIPASAIQAVTDSFAVQTASIARVLGVNERTIRNYKRSNQKLTPQQGEQLLKYKDLLQRGSEVFGSHDAFDRWLHKPAFGLDGDKPFDLLITSEGMNLVSDEVERIANGEFA